MSEEPMPIVGMRDRVPSPVGGLGIREVDAGLDELLAGCAPDIEVALRAARRRPPCSLEPGVLIGGVVDDQFDNDPDATRVCRLDESAEVVERAVGWLTAV